MQPALHFALLYDIFILLTVGLNTLFVFIYACVNCKQKQVIS